MVPPFGACSLAMTAMTASAWGGQSRALDWRPCAGLAGELSLESRGSIYLLVIFNVAMDNTVYVYIYIYIDRMIGVCLSMFIGKSS